MGNIPFSMHGAIERLHENTPFRLIGSKKPIGEKRDQFGCGGHALRKTTNLAKTSIQYLFGWWQLKDFLFSPRKLGKFPILTNIFQRG